MRGPPWPGRLLSFDPADWLGAASAGEIEAAGYARGTPAYRPPAREDSRTHQDEIMAAHASTTVAGAAPASGEGHGPWPRPVI
jgi:hypothetical protein